MTDWTSGSRIKVERAKKHIGDLDPKVLAFLVRRPYKTVSEDDPETGDQVWYIKIAETPPIQWGAIVGDVIHNLRSSLDVLVNQLVYASGWTPSDNLGFPFFETRHKCETARMGEIQRASQTAVKLIKRLKPYPSGNEPLCAIRDLSNADKHRLLTPVGSAVRQWDARWLGFSERDIVTDADPSSVLVAIGERLYPVKDGAEVLRIPAAHRSHMDMEPQFAFSISFGEGKVIKGKPLIPTLKQFADLVDGIIDAFAGITLTPRRRGHSKAPR